MMKKTGGRKSRWTIPLKRINIFFVVKTWKNFPFTSPNNHSKENFKLQFFFSICRPHNWQNWWPGLMGETIEFIFIFSLKKIQEDISPKNGKNLFLIGPILELCLKISPPYCALLGYKIVSLKRPLWGIRGTQKCICFLLLDCRRYIFAVCM